ncbi:MAG: hypothetical protein AAGG68_26670 [Bacteroidota bacterium]
MSKTLKEILDKKEEDILLWLNEIEKKEVEFPSDFNFHGLAEAATTLAFEVDDINLKWAIIGNKVYEILAERAKNSHSFMLSSMNIRIRTIKNNDSDNIRDLLDISKITNWSTDFPLTFNEAKTMSKNWQELNVFQIKKLRIIKDKLRLIERMNDSGFEIEFSNFDDWMNLKKVLP